MDPTCVLCALLFTVGNLLTIIHGVLESREREQLDDRNYEYDAMKKFDSDFIEEMWHVRRRYNGLETSAGLIIAVAWFLFCIPIIQLAWILSLGGKRGLWMHTTMAGFAMGSCFTEFISKLFQMGVSNVTHWLATSMDLNNWGKTNDKLGWKVLEMSEMMMSGMIRWVDAFEWLCLFVILTLTYISTRSLMIGRDNMSRSFTFGRCWAHLGLFIGFLSLFDFLGNILHFGVLSSLMTVSLLLTILNRLILLPIWLCLFGRNLSAATQSFETSKLYEIPTPMNGATTNGVELAPNPVSYPPNGDGSTEL